MLDEYNRKLPVKIVVEASLNDVVIPREHEGKAVIMPIVGKTMVNGEFFDGPFQTHKNHEEKIKSGTATVAGQVIERGMSIRLQSWDDRPDNFGIPREDRHRLAEMIKDRKVRITITTIDDDVTEGEVEAKAIETTAADA